MFHKENKKWTPNFIQDIELTNWPIKTFGNDQEKDKPTATKNRPAYEQEFHKWMVYTYMKICLQYLYVYHINKPKKSLLTVSEDA